MHERIYLDYAATTPLCLEAQAAMEPYLSRNAFGNPSSLHAEGQRARRALDHARDTMARAIGADSSEITFTSGGTEADNMALLGVMLANQKRGNHLITTQIEHEAVSSSAAFLQTLGFSVTYVPVDSFGQVALHDIEEAITDQTILISVMHANNEVGTQQPIRLIAEMAHARGVYVHTDAVQTFAQVPCLVQELAADLLSFSSHKVYGPKGAGALYVRSGIPLEPWLHGGAQERGRRAGTENVAGIVGFAAAIEAMLPEQKQESQRVTHLRDQWIRDLKCRFPDLVLNGHPSERLPNNINISLPGCDSETMLLALDRKGIAASSGSACMSGSIEPSHVLTAMGLSDTVIRSALRFTLGRDTTSNTLDAAGEALGEIADRVKAQARGQARV